VHWAITYLAKAQALKRTRRAHFVITERGQELLRAYPDRLDVRALSQFPEFRELKAASEGSGSLAPVPQTVPPEADPVTEQTPEESIENAVQEISSSLKSQLLERVLEKSPAFFEQLVVDLIVAMGYGGSRGAVAERLGKSGDEGIDGIVNEDPLGLDVVYLQAKRYAADNTIGRPMI
jgi:restriction system protein